MGITSEIITAVITILTLATGFVSYENIKFRRENKQLKQKEVELKQNEVETAHVEVEEKKIDLGEKYLEKVLALTEKSGENQAAMMKKLDLVDMRTDRQGTLLSFMVEYLNGDFNDFLAKKKLKLHGDVVEKAQEEVNVNAEGKEDADGMVG